MIILLVLEPALLVLVLVLAPALLVVAVVASRPLRRLSMRVQDAIATSTTTAEEALAGIRVVKVFGREDWERRHYAQEVDEVVGTGIRLVTWRAGFGAVMTFLGFGALAVILWYTGQQVIAGTLSLGALTAFLLYGAAIGGSLGSLASQYGRFQEGAGAIARVFELIDERPTIVDAADAVALPAVRGRIRFDSVSFGYRPDRPVLRDIALEIEPGEILGVVGPSGSGKTTFCNLVPRLWDVSSGTIEIDGLDLRSVRLADLRQAIALVPQEAPVFGGTIRENILYGRLDATEEELIAASRAAYAHDFIVAMPEGYDTILGDRGSGSRAASGSGSRSRGRSSRTRRSSSSTRRPARSTALPSGSSRRRSIGSCAHARRSSSPTVSRRSATRTGSRSSMTAGSSSSAPTRSCSLATGSTRTCGGSRPPTATTSGSRLS